MRWLCYESRATRPAGAAVHSAQPSGRDPGRHGAPPCPRASCLQSLVSSRPCRTSRARTRFFTGEDTDYQPPGIVVEPTGMCCLNQYHVDNQLFAAVTAHAARQSSRSVCQFTGSWMPQKIRAPRQRLTDCEVFAVPDSEISLPTLDCVKVWVASWRVRGPKVELVCSFLHAT